MAVQESDTVGRRSKATLVVRRSAAQPGHPKPQAEARRPTRQAATSRAALAVKPIVLTPAQAAAVLCVKPSTLKSWRAKGVGPDHVKRDVRLIGYLPAALDAYLRKSGGRKA
jgi:hypothetical protein